MAPTMMNHLSHQEDSDHEQPNDDHREIKSTDPHMNDYSCDRFSVPRLHDEMKEESPVGAMQGSNPVLGVLQASKSCVMHEILFPEGDRARKLYNNLELQQRFQVSQEPLDKYELDGIPDWPPQVFDLDSEASAKRMAILCAVASILCYEDAEAIERVVNGMWNMWFVRFFDCFNEDVNIGKTTQAFMFTDKKENPNAVVIVFRGTERNVADWSMDFDFGLCRIEGMDPAIQVHQGFLKALGLPPESSDKAAATAVAPSPSPDDIRTSGLPRDQVVAANDEPKKFAYDAISHELREILSANPEAKVFVTGHSLGGALAALFTAVLMHKNHGIESKVKGVFTFGQPRVGNASFVQYMKDRLCAPNNARKYFRVVFRNDLVPRVPPDDAIFKFKHISPCVYYESFNHCEIIEEEPRNSLLSAILQPMPHVAAIKELLVSLSHQTEKELRARLIEMLAPAACDHACVRYIEAVKTASSAFLKETA